MTARYDTFITPLGPFSAAVDAHHNVIATAFGDLSCLRTRIKGPAFAHDVQALTDVRRQVGEYFAGRRHHFDLTCVVAGTDFQRKVWQILQTIPFGQTRSYGELARAHGLGGAARALGAANGANPICLFIPCHRVIGADGSLTGYAFGNDVKRGLLDLEKHAAAQAPGAAQASGNSWFTGSIDLTS